MNDITYGSNNMINSDSNNNRCYVAFIVMVEKIVKTSGALDSGYKYSMY